MAYLAFSGSFEHSLDGKGRVIIPASFREALGENFTITINPTRTAVAIYPRKCGTDSEHISTRWIKSDCTII
ncbi:MAG: MraZ N-terminal domain-containing protein [Christensenellales bacterium]